MVCNLNTERKSKIFIENISWINFEINVKQIKLLLKYIPSEQ